jgi:hypothetical protein
MTAPGFIKQYFYDEKGNEIKLKKEDEFLPPATLYKGSKFTYEGRYYQVINVEFIKDEQGKDKCVKVIIRES